MEIIGVVMMANAYIGALPRREVPTTLASALWRGSDARNAAEVVYFTEERAVVCLQGLAFIGLGFLVQAVASAATLYAPGP